MSQPNQPAPRRLGRGLSSLISPQARQRTETSAPPSPRAEDATPEMGQAIMLRIDQVLPNPHQPRREMDEEKLKDLANSIAASGVIQPIVVRHTLEGYELIAGERRLRAARLAGQDRIAAIVRQVDAEAQAQMALIENIQREDLNPVERALAYQALIGQMGLSQSELAGRLGEDRSNIAHYLRLLELPEQVQNWVAQGKLAMGHAKLLAGVGSAEEQQRLAALVVTQGLSVRNLERILNQAPATRRLGPVTRSPHLQDLEKQLTSKLGLRVQVQGRAQGRGKLVIHYASLDEFDSLMERMNVSVE